MSILPAGSLVYRRSHPVGRHKIQDQWESVVYEVVQCLDKVGTLYKIKPKGQLGPERNIHRQELRPLLTDPSTHLPPITERRVNRDNPQERIIQSPDLSSEEELDFLVLKPASPHKEARQQGVTVMPLNRPVLLSSGQGGSLEDIVSGSEEDHVQDVVT